jgi:5-methylthioadenosine/S-adenosylhomocysteine deaminase
VKTVTTLVHAGRVVTAHDSPVLANGAVAICGTSIHEVGTFEELSSKYPEARVFGGDRFLLIPGLINGHSHGRGLSDFQRGARDDTLETWRFETRKYIPVPVYDDVAYSAARLLKSGVTATMHNPSSLQDPTAFGEEFEACLRAYRDAGMRVLFCPGIANDNPFVYGDNAAFLAGLSKKTREAMAAPLPSGALTGANYLQVIGELHARHHGPITRIGFGPMAPQWCTEGLLRKIGQEADRLGAMIHVHAAQTVFQKIYALRTYNRTLIEHLNDLDLLGPSLVIGHCVFPSESDISLLAETDTGVTHHASCNLRVRNGIAPAFHMLEGGVRVGLGLDGKSINDDDDFIQEMKVCFLLHRIPSLELDSPHLSARQVFRMATEIGATLIGFGDELGRLAPGKPADLVLLDYKEMCKPFVDPSHDPIEVLLFRGHGKHVHTVWVNGTMVVESGRLLTIDEDAVETRLAEAASRPRTEKELEQARMLDEVREGVRNYYRGWTENIQMQPYFDINSRVDGL